VRNKATATLQTICSFLSDSQIHSSFVPMIKRLSSEEWFTPKSSACSIFHIAFSRSSNEIQQELIAIYKSFCSDETPMVRRAAATHLKVGRRFPNLTT
jgi:serine/threonine-protein phosphatase 2A regulatory subunit A